MLLYVNPNIFMCDLDFQGHNYFGDFVISGVEKVKFDTKIKSVSCIQAKLKKIIKKGVWPWLWRSTIKVRWLVIMVASQNCRQ